MVKVTICPTACALGYGWDTKDSNLEELADDVKHVTEPFNVLNLHRVGASEKANHYEKHLEAKTRKVI